MPGDQNNFITTFSPKNLGKFDIELFLNLLNNNYQIPLKLYGTSSTVSKKKAKIRGVIIFMYKNN